MIDIGEKKENIKNKKCAHDGCIKQPSYNLSTETKGFTLEKLQDGFFQTFNLGATISVNYSISVDNTTMIKDLEGGRRQTFRRAD